MRGTRQVTEDANPSLMGCIADPPATALTTDDGQRPALPLGCCDDGVPVTRVATAAEDSFTLSGRNRLEPCSAVVHEVERHAGDLGGQPVALAVRLRLTWRHRLHNDADPMKEVSVGERDEGTTKTALVPGEELEKDEFSLPGQREARTQSDQPEWAHGPLTGDDAACPSSRTQHLQGCFESSKAGTSWWRLAPRTDQVAVPSVAERRLEPRGRGHRGPVSRGRPPAAEECRPVRRPTGHPPRPDQRPPAGARLAATIVLQQLGKERRYRT